MSRIDTSLSEVFDVPVKEANVPSVIPAHIESFEEQESSDVEDDAEFVKSTLRELLIKGESAFEKLSEIAEAEESPRSFEVLNTMLTTLSTISMQLLDVHEKKEKIASMKVKRATQTEGDGNATTINNNTNIAFVGTTADLQSLIKEQQLEFLKSVE